MMKPIASTSRGRKGRTPAKPGPYGICPLCEKVYPRRQLRAAIAAEIAPSRRQIQVAIREQYPAWTLSAGACRACWESYRGVARVIHFLQRYQSKHPAPAPRRRRSHQP